MQMPTCHAGVRPTEGFSLADVPLLAGLDPRELERVHTVGVRRRVLAGAELFQEGAEATALYVLVAGRVRVTRAGPNGRLVVLHFAQPGDVLGCALLGGACRYAGTAEVLEDGVVLAFGLPAIRMLVDAMPAISRNALRILSARMEDLRSRYQELATDAVEQRLARALLRLRSEAGDTVGDPVILPVSRQALAELVGSNQYTVSRTLAAWERAGWLTTGRQQVHVGDPQALARVVYGSDVGRVALAR